MDDIIAAIKGSIPERPLLAFWKHFPKADHDPILLAKATLDFQKHFPSDIVKLSPQGRFPVVDFGCSIEYGSTARGVSGSSRCTSCVVKSVDDWSVITEVDPLEGELGKQVEYVYAVSDNLDTVPKMMTVFAPTMVARKLSNNQMIQHYFHENKQEVRNALSVIAKVMIEWAKACVDAGAEGLFIALQEAEMIEGLTPSQVSELISLNGEFYRELHNIPEFTVLHIHGKDVLFKEAISKLACDAVNWHDVHGQPSLEEAAALFKGGLLGGLDPDQVLDGKYEPALSTAIKLRESLPLILAPGCVLWQGTDEQYLTEIIKRYRATAL